MNPGTFGFDPSRLVQAVKATFNDPMRDLTTSALVLGAILIIVLLIIVLLLFTITPRRRKVVTVRRYRRPPGGDGPPPSPSQDGSPDEALPDGPPSPAEEDTPQQPKNGPVRGGRGSAVRSVAYGVTLALVVAGAFVAAYVGSGTQKTCAETCHLGQEAVQTAAHSTHAKCTDCHERPGAAGVLPNAVQRSRMAIRSALGVVPDSPALVDSKSCLHCHAKIVEPGVSTARGIRMSHAEPYDAGMTCTECHPASGHGDDDAYSMRSCMPCHRSGQVSATCPTCHVAKTSTASGEADGEPTSTSGVARSMGSGRITYPVVRVGDLPCGGCHDEPVQCDSCHGLRMPHSDEFVNGGHARMAAFERKQMCYRCHTSDWCSTGCHIGFEAGHVAGWKTIHAESPRDAVCGCHATRSGRTTPMCDLCHDF